MDGKADRIMTNYVTGNYFSALGIKPALGRFILPSEGDVAGADPVMVLGYSYWQTRFGGDPGIVGRKVSVDGHPITIVGVAPKDFVGVYPILSVQGYLPLGMASIAGNPSDFMTNRQIRNDPILARLRPGVSLQQAQAVLAVISQRLAQEYPDVHKYFSVQAFPELHARPNPDPKNTVMVVGGLFLGLAVMVLLLACVNVANILLVRSTVREREMAIRAALGAARIRMIRQLLTESVLLALLGGVAGVLLGYWGSSALGSINVQTDLPIHFDFGFDWRVFGFATAAALLTGIIVGIVPAVRASRGNLSAILHEGGRGVVGGKNRLRSTLVVVQVAGSLMLLIIAGLFTRSLAQAQRTDLGFKPDHVLNLLMDPNEIGYNQAQTRDFYKNLLQRVRTLPGVVSASTANATPMGYYNNFDSLTVDGYHRLRVSPLRLPFTTRSPRITSRPWEFPCFMAVSSPRPTTKMLSTSRSSVKRWLRISGPARIPSAGNFKWQRIPNTRSSSSAWPVMFATRGSPAHSATCSTRRSYSTRPAIRYKLCKCVRRRRRKR